MEKLALQITGGKSILGKGTEATPNSSANVIRLECTQRVQGQQRGCWYDTERSRELGVRGEAGERKEPDLSL